MKETFRSWQRPQISGLATGPIIHARRSAELLIKLADGIGPDQQGKAPFLLAGPQDVVTLTPAAIIGRKPAPGTQDAEITRVAHVELAAPDLPWRFSPDQNDLAGGVKPWLVLVVGETGTEVILEADNQVTLTGAVLAKHDLSKSAAWAHVHEIPGHPISRILSPRPLEEGKDWTAALVPSWLLVNDNLVPTWGANPTDVTIKCFDSWRFRTVDEDDDFRAIAQRLEPLSDDEKTALIDPESGGLGFGRANVAVRGADARTKPKQLPLAGALTVVPASPPAALPKRIATHTSALASIKTHRGRWVLGLPRYDEPWAPTPNPGPVDGWRRQLHEDPRHRGVAGLGAWAAIAWQDRIADGATAQAGALALLAERVRHLGMGLRAARSQWDRRVPADPVAAMTVLGSMLGRLPASAQSSALDDLSHRTPWLVPGLFTSAARRMLRPRSPLARAATPGATQLAALLEVAATRCPPVPPPLPGQKDLPDLVADRDALGHAVDRLQGDARTILENIYESPQMQNHGQEDGHGFDLDELVSLFDGQTSKEAMEMLAGHPAENRCTPVADLKLVAGSVYGAIDPTVARPVVVGRVLDGVTGVREPELAAPDLALELDIPFWSFLRDESPDWLLPGAGTMPLDRVLAMQTNPEFVDAFMIGANQRSLGELRWRNVPIVAGWTPLRRFWQRISDDGALPATDIGPVLDITSPPVPGALIWADTSELGDDAHQTGTPAAMLVILLHTELFRRYPATQVYLMKDSGDPPLWAMTPDADAKPDPAHPEMARIHPNLNGSLHPELVFFGFPLSPEAAASYWLVLEEPPPGFRFRASNDPSEPPLDLDPYPTDGGTYAAKTLNRPIRAFFGNLL